MKILAILIGLVIKTEVNFCKNVETSNSTNFISWNTQSVSWTEKEHLYSRNLANDVNLSGLTVRIVAKIDNNFQIKTKSEKNNDNDAYEISGGFTGNIILDLQFQFNFSMYVQVTNSVMTMSPDGTPGGIAEFLKENKSDMIVGEYYILLYRARSFTPLCPIAHHRSSIFFRRPHFSSTNNIFTSAFSSVVWKLLYAMGSLLIIVTIGATFATKEKIETKEIPFWIFSILCQKNCYNPKKIPIRIIFVFSTMFSILMTIFFSGRLVSTFSVRSSFIKSVEDLIIHGFQFIVPKFVISAYFSDYNETNREITIGNYVVRPVNFFDEADSIKRVVEGGHAYFASDDTSIAAKHDAKEARRIHKICSVISSVYTSNVQVKSGFYVQKKFPYRSHFNFGLLKIMESGLVQRYWIIHGVNTLSQCLLQEKWTLSETQQIDNNDVKIAYLFFTFGVLISLGILVLEIRIKICESAFADIKYRDTRKMFW